MTAPLPAISFQIAKALKTGEELFVTYYDIKKAYVRASMDDMLYMNKDSREKYGD